MSPFLGSHMEKGGKGQSFYKQCRMASDTTSECGNVPRVDSIHSFHVVMEKGGTILICASSVKKKANDTREVSKPVMALLPS